MLIWFVCGGCKVTFVAGEPVSIDRKLSYVVFRASLVNRSTNSSFDMRYQRA